jgi:hypothetical protein
VERDHRHKHKQVRDGDGAKVREPIPKRERCEASEPDWCSNRVEVAHLDQHKSPGRIYDILVFSHGCSEFEKRPSMSPLPKQVGQHDEGGGRRSDIGAWAGKTAACRCQQ